MLQIYKASAGSGKTFMLTREYIKLLLGRKVHLPGGGERYTLRHSVNYGFGKTKAQESILAVTFTNKATEEMTSRIIKELGILADNDDKKPSDYLKYFCELFHTDRDTIARHARRALCDLLFNFSTFNVSTLDSFFQGVLRTFARELDLSGSFNLEIDSSYPVKVAVANMLESINRPTTRMPGQSDEELGQARIRRQFLIGWLEKYLANLSEDAKSILLFARNSSSHRDLVKIIQKLLGETYRMNRGQIDGYLANPTNIQEFHKALAAAKQRLSKKAQTAAADLFKVIDKENLNYNVGNALAKFAQKPYIPSSMTSLTNAYNAGGATKERYKVAFCEKGVTAEIDAALDAALDAATDYIHKVPSYDFFIKKIYILGLFSGVNEHLQRYCEENDAFILSDTNDFLRDLIREEDAPFIYERLGTSLSHYLIDEFQDTSLMQWANMSPLMLESMSRASDNLIIGDEKQSIYRFRNSSPDILGHKVQKTVAERFGNESVMIKGDEVADNTNWRSSPIIVKFNNSLFGPLAKVIDEQIDPALRGGLTLASDTYAGLVQSVGDKNEAFPGLVRIYFEQEQEPSPSDEKQVVTQADDTDNPPEESDWVLEKMSAEIERELRSGFKPSDIAVLVRTNDDGKRVIMHLLKRMEQPDWAFGHIPVVSAAALRVDTSLAVQLIIGVMRLAVTPEYVLKTGNDSKTRQVRNAAYRRARMIHRYNLCLFDQVQATDQDGTPLFNEKGDPVMRRLTNAEALAKAIAATADRTDGENPDPLQAQIDAQALEMKVMDCPSIDALVERIIRVMLPPDCRRHELPYLTAFMDLVLDFQERGTTSIMEFLQWWDGAGKYSTLDSPSGLNAITVTTIHKSKGLQYPCVHVPYCWGQMVSRKGYDWYALDKSFLPEIDPALVPPFLPVPHASVTSIPAFAKDAAKFEHEQRVDALNVTYVAFTRAINELCVYSKANATEESIGPRILEAIRQCTQEFNETISEERRPWLVPLSEHLTKDKYGFELLQLGEPVVANNSENSAKKAREHIEQEPQNGSLQTIEPRKDYLRFLEDGITIYERDEFTVSSDLDEYIKFDFDNDRHRGIFLHGVLSRVRTKRDLPLALDRAAHRYRLKQHQKDIARKILNDALSDPRIMPWFEGCARIINERPLTTPLAIRRPDRIVWKADGTIDVIDYKFGSLKHPKYHEQVRDYAAFLSSSLNRPVKGYLWYPITHDIIPVT